MPTPLFIPFDIETRPLPQNVERFAKPYPEFDESAVKYGNTKDPLKRAELLASKRQEHEDGRAGYWANARDRAALDPFTGAVVCIGIGGIDRVDVIHEQSEAETIAVLWQFMNTPEFSTSKWVFWSGSGNASSNFDIDFLVTRSRILRVPIPARVRSGRFYAERIVDLAAEFLLHQRERFCSLTKAADLLGLYELHLDITPKRDDDSVTGANFHEWWDGKAVTDVAPEMQRKFAAKYLRNDVRTLSHLAHHILP